MPPLAGFSDNPFKTRADLTRAALALLKPLEQYKSPGNARIKLSTASGAGFSETAAQLEGFARPLWVVADLLRLQRAGDPSLSSCDARLETWIEGFKKGTDPRSPEYWGDVGGFDQRMVEMESVAYALLASPRIFGFGGDEETRGNLAAWLGRINGQAMPPNNWRWFRVFVNLALVRVLGVPLDELKTFIEADLEMLDGFEIGEGWSSDGLWSVDRRQADYYSGSFAIQFAQLLFVRLAPDYDVQRTEKYKQQACDFAQRFWRYFGTDGKTPPWTNSLGSAIPFGRSLTYRFAFAAFWGAAAAADIKLPEPLDHPGVVKGILLRHLRWWSKQSHIFNLDGTLNIGYTYPNMYMSEDYNSPQSVYWCLKSFIALSIPEDNPFWSCEEMPHPMVISETSKTFPNVTLVWPPMQILCNTPEHHFMLSTGQSTRKNHKARESKYAKFAYSSVFAFSVSIGPLLEQMAPDSTLCISKDDGESWKAAWEPSSVQHDSVQVGDEVLPTLVSSWKPWKPIGLVIHTTLVPPTRRWPGWHIRIHKVEWDSASTDGERPKRLRCLDSGFAVSAQTSKGDSLFEKPYSPAFLRSQEESENWWKDDTSSLIVSSGGASGVRDLTPSFVADGTSTNRRHELKSQSIIIKPDANTNLISQRTLLPSVQHTADYDIQSREERVAKVHPNLWSFTVVTGIFAIGPSQRSADEIWDMWMTPPTGVLDCKPGDQATITFN
ncbi:hypothetical protein B0O99DRAFT_524745 [Bisporella sp. PMI_857]|nr:hypothetical protein B0O99DRAFT_524745 [Bisporella sp. PMI_857]